MMNFILSCLNKSNTMVSLVCMKKVCFKWPQHVITKFETKNILKKPLSILKLFYI